MGLIREGGVNEGGVGLNRRGGVNEGRGEVNEEKEERTPGHRRSTNSGRE